MDNVEIQVFGMHDNRIAQRGETIEFYDILVSTTEDDEIHEIEEHDDLTETECCDLVEILEAKYDTFADYVGC